VSYYGEAGHEKIVKMNTDSDEDENLIQWATMGRGVHSCPIPTAVCYSRAEMIAKLNFDLFGL
jgi:hypothetical protein